jgi:hypothetical protein
MADQVPGEGKYLGLLPGQTPEQSVGYDIPRVWANGVQVTPTPDVTFIVFREQIAAQEEGKDQRLMLRNVASVILPTTLAIQLAEILKTQISQILPQAEGSGDATP